ncbi:diguanylate cyclase [Erythrobacter arachoides]|uniref:diguanylate cyclase n=1 Tax=Aurantiacibacter arachoides TaxID=1850444 RepID=A0A844ZXR7_9SPHN|nr:diguanylate cyclase [Aurantiacibacter arachoides]MXO92032.1 diguanylate cyclase [Aurantiacibacter arachoides]GGD60300.1 hypothetical protein GCM10011411_20580 [Aurantiacibacter arachoides]
MGARLYLFLALVAATALLALASGAPAPADRAAACHAYSQGPLAPDAALASLDWRCDNDDWEDGHAITWLRYDTSAQGEPPRYFIGGTSVFERIGAYALADGNVVAQARFLPGEVDPIPAGAGFSLPLPSGGAAADTWLIAIERPHNVTIASEARLLGSDGKDPSIRRGMVLLALITGMLVMPLLFDAMFYLVLRERFVLLHAGMTVAMIGYLLGSGGVACAFVEIPVNWLARIGPVSYALGVGLAGLFVHAFLEPDALSGRMRRLLKRTAIWSMIVPVFAGLQLPLTQSFDNRLYFIAFLPVIPIYVAAILSAIPRGSRAAWFLAAAWFPVVAASMVRLLRGMGLLPGAGGPDISLFVALGVEVTIVALAIADRFLAVRRERDRAVTKARAFETLAEHDKLTGLFNRRALEDRFGTLRADGFTTLAVLDLDHFKRVNDRYGHAGGDEVLKCAAQAITPPHGDTLAFRMGGEEFVLLLRGSDTFARAENKRRAITTRIAASGLVDTPVTASMGIVEVPHGALADTGFETLYNRADRLLYEAKAAGRDRTMTERLKVFHPRRQTERRAAA